MAPLDSSAAPTLSKLNTEVVDGTLMTVTCSLTAAAAAGDTCGPGGDLRKVREAAVVEGVVGELGSDALNDDLLFREGSWWCLT